MVFAFPENLVRNRLIYRGPKIVYFYCEIVNSNMLFIIIQRELHNHDQIHQKRY